mmetsp:Transcript_12646/g.25561  ORF Transcript_12646/g.25561 Transcript_12646/m.25561 type:complete len:103 (+) Transcript_12646:112-420(+)
MVGVVQVPGPSDKSTPGQGVPPCTRYNYHQLNLVQESGCVRRRPKIFLSKMTFFNDENSEESGIQSHFRKWEGESCYLQVKTLWYRSCFGNLLLLHTRHDQE